MEVIELNGSGWRSGRDFYKAYSAAVGAPEWRGLNLDNALRESLTGGDIKVRNPPRHIRITGTAQMADDVRGVVERFVAVIAKVRAAGHSITIELLP